MRFITTIIAAAGFVLTVCTPAHPHGGGLDSKGCHNDRKRGGYHCHRAQPDQPVPTKQKATPQKNDTKDKPESKSKVE